MRRSHQPDILRTELEPGLGISRLETAEYTALTQNTHISTPNCTHTAHKIAHRTELEPGLGISRLEAADYTKWMAFAAWATAYVRHVQVRTVAV